MKTIAQIIHEGVMQHAVEQLFKKLDLPPRPPKSRQAKKKTPPPAKPRRPKKAAAPADPLRRFNGRDVVRLWELAEALKISAKRLRLWAKQHECLYGAYPGGILRVGMTEVRRHCAEIVAECGRQRKPAAKPAAKKPAKQQVAQPTTNPTMTPTLPTPTRIATPVPTVPVVPDPLEGLKPYAPLKEVARRLGVTMYRLEEWGARNDCLGGNGKTISVSMVRHNIHVIRLTCAPKPKTRHKPAQPAPAPEPVVVPSTPITAAGPDMKTVLFEDTELATATPPLFYKPGSTPPGEEQPN